MAKKKKAKILDFEDDAIEQPRVVAYVPPKPEPPPEPVLTPRQKTVNALKQKIVARRKD